MMAEARISKDKVPDLYSSIAPVYDLWARLTESRARDRGLELATIQDGESVLEVAVGTGLAFELVLKANPSGRNEGIDLTEAMLARAKTRASRLGIENYRLAVGDAYALDFPDDTFDLLINHYMFDLLPQQDFPAVLTEFKRVLRPGGRLVLVNMTVGERWFNSIWGWVYSINPAWLGGCRGVRISPVMEECGFTGIQREYVSQMTFPSEVVCASVPQSASDIEASQPQCITDDRD
jgi:ubiquinone/menaquinone biosynthesis C-methylase UbiE